MALNLFSAQAFEYELRGEIRGEQYFNHGTTQSLGIHTFQVFVRNCEWKMRVVPDEQNQFSKRIGYWEYSFDGKEARSVATVRNESGELKSWEGSISNDQIPAGTLVPHFPIAWFAVASACYLENSSGAVTPVYLREFRRPSVDALIFRRNRAPYLPEKVIFLSPAPMSGGAKFTNAIYSADYQEYESLDLPAKFSMEVFDIDGREQRRRYLYQGAVLSVTAKCSVREFSVALPVDPKGKVWDYRFVSENALSIRPFLYESSNWLSRAEAALKPGFLSYVMNKGELIKMPNVSASVNGPTALKSRSSFVVLFLLVSGFPLLAWALTRKRITQK